MKHKHADLIHAWADGAQIQWKDPKYDNPWDSIKTPAWFEDIEYRIKPEPMPDVPRSFCVDSWGHNIRLPYPHTNMDKPNLRLVFEGETGKLKSAEVLK
jgi:hypothetical protein